MDIETNEKEIESAFAVAVLGDATSSSRSSSIEAMRWEPPAATPATRARPRRRARAAMETHGDDGLDFTRVMVVWVWREMRLTRRLRASTRGARSA